MCKLVIRLIIQGVTILLAAISCRISTTLLNPVFLPVHATRSPSSFPVQFPDHLICMLHVAQPWDCSETQRVSQGPCHVIRAALAVAFQLQTLKDIVEVNLLCLFVLLYTGLWIHVQRSCCEPNRMNHIRWVTSICCTPPSESCSYNFVGEVLTIRY